MSIHNCTNPLRVARDVRVLGEVSEEEEAESIATSAPRARLGGSRFAASTAVSARKRFSHAPTSSPTVTSNMITRFSKAFLFTILALVCRECSAADVSVLISLLLSTSSSWDPSLYSTRHPEPMSTH